ncbi:MAG: hypothetical protein JWO48_3 [Bryobacterales bacterium]|nr:hypothetical protein [Bryobacterales bacterium]
MSRTLLVRIFAGIPFLLISWIGYTQGQTKQPPQLTLNKVKEDLYEIEGDGGNVAVQSVQVGIIPKIEDAQFYRLMRARGNFTHSVGYAIHHISRRSLPWR